MAPPTKRAKKGKDRPRIKPGSVKPVREAKFDDEARRDFLTGFSKRKQAKKLAGRQKAEAKEKEELLRLRREFKQQQKAQAAENVKQAQAAFAGSDDEEMEAEEGMAPEEQAYEDEQFETTVTVEEFDVSAPVDGPRRPGRNDHRPAKPDKRPRDKNARSGSSRPSSKGKTR